MRKILLAFLLLACAGCGGTDLVVVVRLEPGQGGMATTSAPQLDIVIRTAADATDFNPTDLMRVLFDGVDRADEVVLAGRFGLLRIDPAPVGTHLVELLRRRGPVVDRFTWEVLPPVSGPALAGVSPTAAEPGQTVTISGSLLSGGPVRVFFGGVEGTVVSSNDSTITATVPAGAVTGLVWVLVGADAAQGLVGFQPLDSFGLPIRTTSRRTLFAAFPGRGPPGTVVEIYGIVFDDTDHARIRGKNSSRILGIERITLPVAGELCKGFVIIANDTPSGADEILVSDRPDDNDSNALPFTVEE